MITATIKRIPQASVVVQRDGKNYIPEIGKEFRFTQQEVADIEAANPDALRKIESVEKSPEQVEADRIAADAKRIRDEELANEAKAQAEADKKAEEERAAADKKAADDAAKAAAKKPAAKSASKGNDEL